MATSPVDPPDPDARPATTAVSGAYIPAAGDEHAERRPPFDRFIRPLLPVGLRRVGQRRFPRLAAWFKRFGTSSVEPLTRSVPVALELGDEGAQATGALNMRRQCLKKPQLLCAERRIFMRFANGEP